MSAKWILLSVAIHGLAMALFYFKPTAKPSEVTPPVVVEVTRIDPPSPTGRREHSGEGPASRLTLRDLGIHWRNGMPATDESESSTKGESEESQALGPLLGQIRNTVAYETIYRLVDEALHYPAELREADIEGVVRARIVFSTAGQYERKFSHISSHSPYLRVFVVRVLEKALSEPLPESYRREKIKLRINCVFFFDLTRKDNPMEISPKAMQGHSKNRAFGKHFAFYRSAKVFGEWSLGPIKGYGIMPSVGVDPEWFIDKAADLMSDKAKMDPLTKYREDPEWDRES